MYRKVVAPAFGTIIDPAEVIESDGRIPEILSLIDGWIEEYGFVAGDHMTIADLLAYE